MSKEKNKFTHNIKYLPNCNKDEYISIPISSKCLIHYDLKRGFKIRGQYTEILYVIVALFELLATNLNITVYDIMKSIENIIDSEKIIIELEKICEE